MSKVAELGIRAIKIANSILNAAVLTIIFLLIALGCYSIWDSQQIYKTSDSSSYDLYEPNAENGYASFQKLQEINPEIFAWLTVYGTSIDYPVAQGKNNLKYINTSAKGQYSLTGSIFLDYRNKQNFSDFNSIFYGHHMEKQSMFGEIDLFSDKTYFDNRRYGNLYFSGNKLGLEFFAFLHTDAYDTSVFRINQEKSEAYLTTLLRKSIHVRENVAITKDDKIVLLATCSSSSTNGRDILVGRISSKIYEDTFKTEKVFEIPIIDELTNLWIQAPVWLKTILIAFLVLLIAQAVVSISRFRLHGFKRKKHSQNGGK